MITNADITIYNLAHKETRNEHWVRTIIRGVSWHGGQKVTVTDKGLLSANAYTVRIPLLSAPNGKIFVVPEEFAVLEDDVLNGFWTLQNGDLILRGEGPEISQPKEVTKRSQAFLVTGWADNRRGGLQHWKVEGK